VKSIQETSKELFESVRIAYDSSSDDSEQVGDFVSMKPKPEDIPDLPVQQPDKYERIDQSGSKLITISFVHAIRRIFI